MALQAARSKDGALAEINVTPMADIMIVLLIIFMVVTPMVGDDRIALPRAAHDGERNDDEVLVVTVRADGSTLLGDEPVAGIESLGARLRERLALDPEGHSLVLKADERLGYADVMKVLDVCRAAGVQELTMSTARRRS